MQGAKVIAGPQSKFFIPQKMYLSEGCSLRGQITYPKKTEGPDPNEDEFILLLLTDLGNRRLSVLTGITARSLKALVLFY